MHCFRRVGTYQRGNKCANYDLRCLRSLISIKQ